jgi:uncharacterized repeat protein (TIGR01451 family)
MRNHPQGQGAHGAGAAPAAVRREAFRAPLFAAIATLCAGLASAPAQAWTPGKDGVVTIGAANTVINQYTTLASAATAGAATLTLASTAGITPGDVLLIYQAQGASIGTVNGSAYGAVSSLGNAGRYEFVSVAAVSGSTVTLGTACDTTPLRFSYNAGAQAIRVPQYSSLTVAAGASAVAQPWNGSTGGVVAAIVQGTATVNGSVHANALGFRGGVRDNLTNAASADTALYVSTLPADGAEKGESIAGFQAVYDAAGGRYGRGAPANGGGGGNSHNAGGGGGANGGSAVGWNGQGVPSTTTAGWAAAWNLDGTLNASTNSPGGGRGGYTYSANNADALTTAPGDAAWGGNVRRERGGLGGRPLANNPGIAGDTRLFFGGGGGAGDGNNNASEGGANGGGLVYLIAGNAGGSGSLQANGATAPNTLPNHNDAPGGGGGGGSIVLVAPAAGGLALSATGGNGGSQLITNNEAEGPGGGGGGGFIASPAAGNVNGGNNGTTTSASLTEFVPNGGTRGHAGNATSAPALGDVPICTASSTADLVVTKTNTPAAGPVDQPADTVVSGAQTTYSLVVTNAGPGTVSNAVLRDTPGAGLTCPPANPVTCTSTATPSACPAGALTVADLANGVVLGTLPATTGSNTATFTFTCTVQ